MQGGGETPSRSVSGPDHRPLNVAIVGCGLIGSRRAQYAQAAGDTILAVSDLDTGRAQALAAETGARVGEDWRQAVVLDEVDVVVVATTNDALADISAAALEAGKSVLCEKPLGRTAKEAAGVQAACGTGGQVLKTGFTLRQYGVVRAIRRLIDDGSIGDVLTLRMTYGHGGRLGYDREWRADREVSGGGQLLDQGVHLIDLARCIGGEVARASGLIRTHFWDMEVEDTCYATLESATGAVTTLHTSSIQWRNLFRLEVLGSQGALLGEGLGGSYGPPHLTRVRRRPEFGVPEAIVDEPVAADHPWALEWDDFRSAVLDGEPVDGSGLDGLRAAEVCDALYESSATGRVIDLQPMNDVVEGTAP